MSELFQFVYASLIVIFLWEIAAQLKNLVDVRSYHMSSYAKGYKDGERDTRDKIRDLRGDND